MERISVYSDCLENAGKISGIPFDFGTGGQASDDRFIMTEISHYYRDIAGCDEKKWYEIPVIMNSSLTYKRFLQYDWNGILEKEKAIAVCEYCFCDDNLLWLDDRKSYRGRDLSGALCGFKLLGDYSDKEGIITCIEEVINTNEPVFLSAAIICVTQTMIEVRLEFAEDFDLLPVLKSMKKYLPNIRILGVQKEEKWENQLVYKSGNSSKKVQAKKVRYQQGWDTAYNHLSCKSDFGNHQFYEPDLMVTKAGELQKCNEFFWAETIILPDGLKEIKTAAFHENKHLKKIVIPASVEKIGRYAFADCSNLIEVVNNSDAEIAQRAFENCKKLK